MKFTNVSVKADMGKFEQERTVKNRKESLRVTETNFIELIIAFVTLVFGVISIIGSMVFRLCYRRKIDLEYLGWGILLVAVWNITNSGSGQVLFQNPSAAADVTVFVTLLMPLPFFLYVNEVQKGRYQRWYRLAEILLSIEVVTFSWIAFFKAVGYYRNSFSHYDFFGFVHTGGTWDDFM